VWKVWARVNFPSQGILKGIGDFLERGRKRKEEFFLKKGHNLARKVLTKVWKTNLFFLEKVKGAKKHFNIIISFN